MRARLVLPEREAAVFALDAHGLNDRCGLYQVPTACVANLGAAFCRVAIELDANREAASYLTLLQGSAHKSMNVNVGEVLALALHGGFPSISTGPRTTARLKTGRSARTPVCPMSRRCSSPCSQTSSVRSPATRLESRADAPR